MRVHPQTSYRTPYWIIPPGVPERGGGLSTPIGSLGRKEVATLSVLRKRLTGASVPPSVTMQEKKILGHARP